MPKMRITEQESWERLNFIGFTPSSTLLVVKFQYRGFFLLLKKAHRHSDKSKNQNFALLIIRNNVNLQKITNYVNIRKL